MKAAHFLAFGGDTIIAMEIDSSDSEIKRLIEENSALVRENNELVKKMYRATMLSFSAHIAWYAIIIIIPLVLYFVLEPYFEAARASFEHIADIPGMRKFMEAFEAYKQ